MNILRKLGLVGVTLASLAGTSVNANAGVITLKNNTVASGIAKTYIDMKNISGATDAFDNLYDSLFLPPIETNALEIYTKVEGNKLSTDARPVDTEGWDFYLGVKGSVSGIDNYLRYKITDTTNLEGKTLTMYDTANPSNAHTLLMDGQYHNISLPTLTASNEEYAHWRLALAPIGDANLDGIVDASDYIITKDNFGTQTGATWQQGDFSGNGSVGYEDLQMLMNTINNPMPVPSAQTPAPATALIFSALSLPVLMNRRKR